MEHMMVGFGFGPIQSGLFAAEARRSGRFADIAIAEVDAALVEALRRNGKRYAVNVAREDGIDVEHVGQVLLLNPRDVRDRAELEARLKAATEIITSLPSVNIFTAGGTDSVAALIARGLQGGSAAGTVVYTAENNNHAAEILERDVKAASGAQAGAFRPVQFLNTVIGKMSQVISDPAEISRRGLMPIAPGFPRAFLVESFCHILTSRIQLPGFEPGIDVFEQKSDLLPFEEAKLFGHNAIHTLLGFIGREHGCSGMAQLRDFPDAMDLARHAFIDEAGAALVKRHAATGDRLFTPDGFRQYADELLQRMTNPHLNDAVARIVRDPVRKLGFNDRVFGPMRLCLENGIEPLSLACGARAGLKCLLAEPGLAGLPLPADATGSFVDASEWMALLEWLWKEDFNHADARRITDSLTEKERKLNHV